MKDLHARVPVDKTAAIVTARGVHFDPNKIVKTDDSEMPIETREPNKCERNSAAFVNLTGVKFGRFVVVGIAARRNGKWAVRCLCGRYSTRTAKAIKNAENSQDRCEHCRHLAFLKREERYRATGRDADIRDF